MSAPRTAAFRADSLGRHVIRAHRALAVVLLGVAGVLAAPLEAAEAPATVRLYAMDCGHMNFKDLAFFSDTLEFEGKSGSIAVPCFLIRHPKGNLLWDTGLSPDFAKRSDADGISGAIDVPVTTTLQQVGLTPADIKYVGFSHFHADHTGNANVFTSSTWIINKAELAWAVAEGPTGPVEPDTFSAYTKVKTQMITGDYDVFGDGSVRIILTPGHTPGHSALMLKLKKTGTVLLSGDLYHFRRDRENRYVMGVNTNRADTLASFDRFEKIAKNTHARVIIQHDPDDFKALPKFPAYLE